MTIILTDGPPPEKTGSPLDDIYDHAFPIADQLSIPINDSVLKMIKNHPDFKDQMSDAIIVHSVALMLIICMMNREILDSNDLDRTFAKVKQITQDYIKHLLTSGKESSH